MSDLNSYQAAAVACDAVRVAVRAGAGSGKTRVLVARARRAVAAGARHVVLVTFTRSAAREMADRLGPDAEHVSVGTVHALASVYLRRYWSDRLPAGVDEHFQVAGDGAGDLADATTPGHAAGTLHRSNLLSYDDLLALVLQCLADPETAGRMPKADLVLVDEAHDLTMDEWTFIRALGLRRFVVGDPAQAIFGWRGGVLREFLAELGSARVFDLPINYRSRPEIIAVANRVPTPGRIDVQAGTQFSPALVAPVRVVVGDGAGVVEGILRSTGCAPADVAVLARTKRVLRQVAGLLDGIGIPWRAPVLADDTWSTPQGVTVVAAAHVAADPDDSLHLRHLLTVAGWSALDLARAERGRAGAACSLWQWCLHDSRSVAGFDALATVSVDQAVSTLLTSMFGWGASARHQRPFDILRAWSASMPDEADRPADFLRWLADPQREQPDTGAGVLLTTIHGAKGLEWPHVVVWGMEDGAFPLARAERDGQLDEERRLFYVAVTRAVESLTFRVAATTRRGRDEFPATPSRFLDECGVDVR